MFDGANPSIIVPHSALKLRELWKEINGNYVKALARSQVSGTHETFRNFVGHRGDTLYLWYWLKVKPGLTDFVRGGLLPQDEFDSLRTELHTETPRKTPTQVALPSPKKTPRTLLNIRRAKHSQTVAELAETAITYMRARARDQQHNQMRRTIDTIGRLRRMMSEVEQELEHAPEVSCARLEEDLAFLSSQRKRLMQRSRDMAVRTPHRAPVEREIVVFTTLTPVSQARNGDQSSDVHLATTLSVSQQAS